MKRRRRSIRKRNRQRLACPVAEAEKQQGRGLRSAPQTSAAPGSSGTALDRWARDRAIGTEHATIASEGLKLRPAALAVMEELAGIGWHRLDGLVAA
jgi:hypothetical protein